MKTLYNIMALALIKFTKVRSIIKIYNLAIVFSTSFCISYISADEKNPIVSKIGEGIYKKSDGICILDQKNKNLNLIIEQSWDGDARIWKFKNGKWEADEIYSGLGQCFSPVVYDFSGKGNYSIFLGSWDKNAGVYQIELSKTGKPSKDIKIIPQSNQCGSILCLRVENARNDGTKRLYVGSEGNGGGLYEFTKGKKQNEWIISKIHSGSVGEFAIGEIRKKGFKSIYAGDRGGKLYEFEWANNSWQKHEIPLPVNDVRTVAIGDGRGDGINRLYVNAGNKSFEVEFKDGKWIANQVGRDGTRYYFAIAKSTNSPPKVYSTIQGIGLFQWIWKDNQYHETQIDAVTSATGGISIGDARGDGIQRLYVTNGDRQKTAAVIWELSLD